MRVGGAILGDTLLDDILGVVPLDILGVVPEDTLGVVPLDRRGVMVLIRGVLIPRRGVSIASCLRRDERCSRVSCAKNTLKSSLLAGPCSSVAGVSVQRTRMAGGRGEILVCSVVGGTTAAVTAAVALSALPVVLSICSELLLVLSRVSATTPWM